jgi:hypothetical protein
MVADSSPDHQAARFLAILKPAFRTPLTCPARSTARTRTA